MKTLIEALRLMAIGATIGTALAALVWAGLAVLGLHTPLSDLGMRAVVGFGGALMALFGWPLVVLALVARAAETARASRVREVQR